MAGAPVAVLAIRERIGHDLAAMSPANGVHLAATGPAAHGANGHAGHGGRLGNGQELGGNGHSGHNGHGWPAWLRVGMAQAVAAIRGNQVQLVVLHESGQRYGESLCLVRLSDLEALGILPPAHSVHDVG
jgi:hypothetical protein